MNGVKGEKVILMDGREMLLKDGGLKRYDVDTINNEIKN